MWLDIVFLIILVFGVLKGIRRGLIIAVFSFIALFIGLAAAIKLSAYLATYLHETAHISTKWLPLLSFIIVFVVVVLLVQWAGKMIETAFDFALLGWVNKIGGAIFYVGIYTIIFSVVLFYADKMHLISQKTEVSSKAYGLISPIAPTVIDGLGTIIPFFKNMFRDLEDFFDNVHRGLPEQATQVF